ncbi:uncharacterized protein [Diadema antillarum]|uniref:uncharacterized protein n=1 Tax=Diadema antillarum TaxID=105358 RepID=UPI003A88E892
MGQESSGQARKDEREDDFTLIKRDVTGVVKSFLATRGYGFIDRHSLDLIVYKDVFFHHSAIVDDHPRNHHQTIEKEDGVIFDLGIVQNGYVWRYVARRVRLMSQSETDDEEWATASEFSDRSSNCEETSELNSVENSDDDDGDDDEEEYETESNFRSSTGIKGSSHRHHPKDKSAEASARPTDPSVLASVMLAEERTLSAVDNHEAYSQERMRCLKEALKLYKEAYQLARTDEDNVSAAKNVAVTSVKLATLCREFHSYPREDKVIEDHFMEAAEYFAKAYSKKNCKSLAWGNHLEECLQSCVSEYLDLKHTQITLKDKAFRLDAFQERLPNSRAKARAKLFLALGLYEIGFEKAKTDREGCLQYMTKCLGVLDNAESLYDGLAEETSLPRLRKAVNACIKIVKRRMTKSADEITRTSARVTAPPASASVEKRTLGNGLFKSADDHEAGSLQRVRCLKEALELYKEACQLACTDEEGVSAAKNVAMTFLKLATLYREHGNYPSGDKGIENDFVDAAKYFARAFSKGKCKPLAWRSHLGKCIENCLQEFRSWVSHMTVEVKATKLEEFLECLPVCHSKAVGKVMLAQYAYNTGLEISQTNEYEECLRYMKRCSLLLDDAERTCGGEGNVMTNVRTLRQNVDACKESVKKRLATAAELQRRLEREKQETEEKTRALESLKPKLKKLNSLTASSLSTEMFVQKLFDAWPPKSSTVAMNCNAKSSGSAKKCLLQAIACYHPDKVDKAAHGMEWYYFCCEVTKCLNKMLAKYKQ